LPTLWPVGNPAASHRRGLATRACRRSRCGDSRSPGRGGDRPASTRNGLVTPKPEFGEKAIARREAAGDSPAPIEHPTEAMSLFEIEQAENVSQKPRRSQAGLRFVLKFESGLSFTVGDTPGIIGSSPLPQEPETAIHRISVSDEGGTVEAEHLQFGLNRGVFWVKDLETVAGTVVEEPGSPALQCIPNDSYSLVRGSRVTMGSLSFTLH